LTNYFEITRKLEVKEEEIRRLMGRIT